MWIFRWEDTKEPVYLQKPGDFGPFETEQDAIQALNDEIGTVDPSSVCYTLTEEAEYPKFVVPPTNPDPRYYQHGLFKSCPDPQKERLWEFKVTLIARGATPRDAWHVILYQFQQFAPPTDEVIADARDCTEEYE